MKYVKMLGLLAMAAAALMAFAGTASATTLTSPKGTTYTGTITAVNEGSVTLDGSFSDVVCKKSHVKGTVEQHGTGVTAGGNLSELSFGECNFATTVENPLGSLEVHPITTKEPPTTIENCKAPKTECTGTLTASGQKVVVHTSVGTCTFTTSNTDIGIITPTNDTGGTPTLDIGSHGTGIIPRTEGSFLCGSSGQWTGSYVVETPMELWIDAT